MDGFKPHDSTSTMLGGGRRQKTPLYTISYKMIDENVIKNAEIQYYTVIDMEKIVAGIPRNCTDCFMKLHELDHAFAIFM